jgi:hypothetical protein
LFSGNRDQNWRWFENILSYDNARLSQALFVAYDLLGEREYLDVAEESLEFLENITTIDGTYVPIGTATWCVRGGERGLYDQQPIEAGSMVETTALAYRITRSARHEKALRQAFGWFLGANMNRVNVYDESTGACHDGITPEGLNENQGAESTIAFLLAAESFVETFGK